MSNLFLATALLFGAMSSKEKSLFSKAVYCFNWLKVYLAEAATETEDELALKVYNSGPDLLSIGVKSKIVMDSSVMSCDYFFCLLHTDWCYIFMPIYSDFKSSTLSSYEPLLSSEKCFSCKKSLPDDAGTFGKDVFDCDKF